MDYQVKINFLCLQRPNVSEKRLFNATIYFYATENKTIGHTRKNFATRDIESFIPILSKIIPDLILE